MGSSLSIFHMLIPVALVMTWSTSSLLIQTMLGWKSCMPIAGVAFVHHSGIGIVTMYHLLYS